MKTKKKSKKMVGRSALMASLIVAAITGVTPAFATSDNLTDSKAGKIVNNTDGTYIAAKSVTLTGVATGKTVSLAVVSGGKLYVGKGFDAPGAAASGVFNNPNTTLTTDNMTIEAGGTVEVSNNSTLKIVKDYPLVAGTLTLNNGTVNIMGGEGTLQIAGNTGKLDVTGGVNAIQGSLLVGEDSKNAPGVTGTGTVAIAADAQLNITKNLTVNNGTVNNSGTLVVDGTTSGTASGTINIESGGQMTAKKSDFVDGTTNKVIGAVVKNEGTLYLNMTGTYTDTDITNAQTAIKKADGSAASNVAFLGGTLVNNNGVAKDVIVTTGTDSIALGNKAVLANSNTAITATIGAKTLEVTTGTKVEVSTGKLQLTGNGGELITGSAAGNVAISGTNGTLDLGIAGNEAPQGGHLSSIDMTAAGKVNVTDGIFTTDKLTASAGTITVKSEGKTTVFAADETSLSGNAHMDILHSTANLGTLKSTTGSSILIDPATVVIEKIDATTGLGADVLVGLGGNLVIGDTNANWMLNRMSDLGVKPQQKNTSVLAVRETVKLATGGAIYLDPTVTKATTPLPTPTHDLTFNAGSLVIADMENLKDGVIFDLTNGDKKTAVINDGAKLYLTGLKFKNDGQQLIKGASTGGITMGPDGTGWTGENGMEDSDIMLNAGFDPSDGTLTVTINKASKVMNNMSSDMDGLMDEVWRTSENSVNSLNAGKKLVSRAADSNYMTPTEGARVVEGAARMAVVGATQQMAFAASNAATSAATQRTSMANPMANSSGTLTALVREEGSQQWKAENTGLSAGNGLKNGAALWIMPLYQNMNAWNMKADNFNTGYSANFGGVALGGDYTFADAFRVGLALNIGGGFAESNGDFAKTENNFNFWGINLYGGWAQNNFAVTADVGYTSTFNDVKQDTPLNLGMSEFKTDMYSYAITAGLRGEYKVQTDYVDIIPHIAARYTNLHSDDYKIKSGGETVFKGEAIDQSIWTFPIGVAFSKDVDMSNGWTFKPQLDLAVIPAAGDIAAKSKVKIPGNSVTADLESNIIDGISYQGALGFDMYKDNIAFGINYTIQASEHTTGHGVQATVRYEF